VLARARAAQPLLHVWNEAPRAELDELVAPLAARERLAHLSAFGLERPRVVDDDEVAIARGLVDGLEARRALAQRVELALDRLGVGGRLAAPDLDALVAAERRRRAHADLDRERQRLALPREVAEVEVGLADGMDAGVVDGLDVPAPERPAHGLVEDRVAPDAADDDRRRDLALAEAGHAQVAPDPARGLLETALHLGRGDLGLHAHARLGQLGDGRLERGRHGRRTIASAPHATDDARGGLARHRAARPPRRRRRRLGGAALPLRVVAGHGVSAKSGQCPGTPLSSCMPRSAKRRPDPTTVP
jgi:hypothetical protein